MSKDKLTWFGFKLTKKQSLNLFIISIIGTLILIFIYLTMITNWMLPGFSGFFYFYYYDYEEQNYDIDYYIRTLIRMLPAFIIITILLIICIYSLIKAREISRSYPDLEPTITIESKIPLFCPNCGNKISGVERIQK
ncbi:hypothetical protein LCGC14_2724590 [marine sediment metagenome]|uniref:Uncharacterized protein n=1 Tax=marine sediment metagenome TaxID=412755 RepID=A0A0F8XZ25_9ZZZZ